MNSDAYWLARIGAIRDLLEKATNPKAIITSTFKGMAVDTVLGVIFPPKDGKLPGFPGATPTDRKTPRQGGGGKRHRWNWGKFILEWDYQHGTIELYDKRGHHLGEFNYETRKQLKPAKKGRRIEP
jgi:hypothetical protein